MWRERCWKGSSGFPTSWASALHAMVTPGSWANGHKLTIYRDHVLCPQIFCRGREKVRGRENGGLQGNDVM